MAASTERSRNGDTAGARRQPANYLVFEAPREALKPGDKLTFVGRIEQASDKKDARWKAVGLDEKLAARVLYDPEKPDADRGVWLVAVAERNVAAERTVEDAMITKVRS